MAGSEAERLLGRGDFLLIAKGQMIRFQAAYAADAELAAIVARIREGGRRRRQWDQVAQPANSPNSPTRARSLRAKSKQRCGKIAAVEVAGGAF